MKKSLKFLLGIIVFVILIFLGDAVYAADATISAEKTSLKIGESTSITVSVSQTEAWSLTVSSNGGKLTGTLSSADAAGEEVSKGVINAQFSASAAGTYTVSLSGSITGSDLVKKTVSKPIQITVKEETLAPESKPETPTTSSKSSDAILKSLKIGDWPVTVQDKVDITVDSSYEKLTINAVPKDSKATLSGNGVGAVDLEEGTNNFKIIVKAEDGTTKEYKIVIRRKAATTAPSSPPNVIEEEKEESKAEEKTDEEAEEFGLSNLVITGIKLNPTFDINVFEYTAEFSEDTDILEIITKASSEDATVEVVGNTNLKIGENLITVMVKSADGETTKTYQITATKNEPVVETSATANDTLMNTVVSGIENNLEVKKKLGRIGLIAVAAIIAVILLGIIVIMNTKKKEDNDFGEENIKPKKNKFGKEDFRVAVNEEEAYRELEKLSTLHNRNNILNEEQNNLMDGETADNINTNQEMNNENFSTNNNLEDQNPLEQLVNDSISEELIIEEQKMHNPYEETKNDFLAGFENNNNTYNENNSKVDDYTTNNYTANNIENLSNLEASKKLEEIKTEYLQNEIGKTENKKHKKSKGKRFK